MRKNMQQNKIISLLLTAALATGFAACTPTVKVQAPDKPIEINLNVKIEQEVRIKVEKDLEDAFADSPELFGTAATEEKKQ